MDRAEMSIKDLRDRLYDIAAGTGDTKLAKSCRTECLDTIIPQIVRYGYAEYFVRKFFADMPYGEDITAHVLNYSGNGKALEAALLAVGKTVLASDAMGEVQKVAEALDQEAVHKVVSCYKGRVLEIAMEHIGEMALCGRDADAVRKAAEKYIGSIAYLTKKNQ